jgi:protein-disulfide isomerase
MNRFAFRAAMAVLLAPLALGLAACGDKGESGPAGLNGDPVAPIAAPAGKAWADIVAETEMGGHLIGNPDAPIRLVEYASLTCPHCADFYEKAEVPLFEKYIAKGTVGFELRNQIHDGLDLTLNLLVRCSGPEAYHPLSGQVWSNLRGIVTTVQANGPKVEAAMKSTDQATRYKAIADAAGLTDFFAARGISSDQAASCLAKPGVADKLVNQSDTQSKGLNIEGTPSFLLNGAKLDAKGWPDIEAALQQAGAR